MDIEEYALKRKGWHNQLIYEQTIFRRLAYIIHISLVEKPKSAEKLWPLPTDTKRAKGMTPEQRKVLDKFREQEALKKHKSKKNQ